ncbi:hypothetical protein FE36_20475 [Xanthomonas oryzae pv. oryzicola]|nr:hypothetical protein [Xanthomonas oryzae]AKK65973.1 hypothetical protein FE36_20475 [Xanthomonas oryzae pv. oryzicola]
MPYAKRALGKVCSGGDITFACPGQFTVKASMHPFLGGESGSAALPPLPDSLKKPDGTATFSV